jgi:urea carboxylase
VEAGTYKYNVESFEFVPEEFFEDPEGFNDHVREVLYG